VSFFIAFGEYHVLVNAFHYNIPPRHLPSEKLTEPDRSSSLTGASCRNALNEKEKENDKNEGEDVEKRKTRCTPFRRAREPR